ncbi:MAG: hypothetical protein HKN27_05970 [Silicimonas sp.]|nr:hypothetical protein [Silicimonas sp.]
MTDKTLSFAVLLAAIAFAVVPFFTSFNGYGPDAFPIPQIDPPAQPAGYAFSIWGVIYIWLIVSGVIGMTRQLPTRTWYRARIPLLMSLLAGVAWLPVAESNPIAATFLIWFMLITALLALARAPKENRWAFRAPLGLYAGWLGAASWVSVALVGAGFGVLFDATTWAIIIIVAATALSTGVLLRLPAIPEFGVAVIWALVAVVVKQGFSTTPGVLAAVGAAWLALLTVRHIVSLRQ